MGLVRPGAAVQVQPGVVPPSLPSGAAGFAELAVDEWLTSVPSSQNELARLFIGDVQAPAVQGAISVDHVSAVDWRTSNDGAWFITVAAVFRIEADAAVRRATWHLEVTVIGDSGSFRAVGSPALLPAPIGVGPSPPSALERPAPSDPVAMTVGGFLDALLAANGDVARYSAPDRSISPVVPAPCDGTALTGLESEVAEDTARARALVECSIGDDRWTFEYLVALGLRDGRWEVRSVGSSPARSAPPGSGGPSSLSSSSSTTSTSIAAEPGA